MGQASPGYLRWRKGKKRWSMEVTRGPDRARTSEVTGRPDTMADRLRMKERREWNKEEENAKVEDY